MKLKIEPFHLLFIIGIVINSISIADEDPNVAQHTKAMQSCTVSNFGPDYAIDGSKTTPDARTCNQSSSTNNVLWWTVELPSIYNVSEIVLTGSTDDCCKTLLSNYAILLSNEPIFVSSDDRKISSKADFDGRILEASTKARALTIEYFGNNLKQYNPNENFQISFTQTNNNGQYVLNTGTTSASWQGRYLTVVKLSENSSLAISEVEIKGTWSRLAKRIPNTFGFIADIKSATRPQMKQWIVLENRDMFYQKKSSTFSFRWVYFNALLNTEFQANYDENHGVFTIFSHRKSSDPHWLNEPLGKMYFGHLGIDAKFQAFDTVQKDYVEDINYYSDIAEKRTNTKDEYTKIERDVPYGCYDSDKPQNKLKWQSDDRFYVITSQPCQQGATKSNWSITYPDLRNHSFITVNAHAVYYTAVSEGNEFLFNQVRLYGQDNFVYIIEESLFNWETNAFKNGANQLRWNRLISTHLEEHPHGSWVRPD